MVLPNGLSGDYGEVDVRVTKYCTMMVKKVLYSAPSRLVGHRLKLGSMASGWSVGWAMCACLSCVAASPTGQDR